MVSAGADKKRKSTLDHPVSPPPLRRKIQSSTTKSSVASFFTPTSQKPPEKIIWQERAPDDDTPATLLVGKFSPSNVDDDPARDTPNITRRKIAAFDFDSTLILTSSGKTFASNANDWKWWHASVPGILQKLYKEEGYQVVVLSNQGGLSMKGDTKGPKAGKQAKIDTFKAKTSAVFNQLDIPINIYAATGKDMYRKPRIGMWEELLDDYDIDTTKDLDLENSIFVGDAAGRHASHGKAKDFSCSDRNFAENVGIKFYTPEEYFLHEEPRPFTRTFDPSTYIESSPTITSQKTFSKRNEKEIVLFCGSPGAGKSTFYWRVLEPLGYVRVNQDTLKTRDKCVKVAGEQLADGKSVVIDNTNPNVEVRGIWVELAKKYSVPIRCISFTTPMQMCQHNDTVRALNQIMNPEKRAILPGMAFNSFTSRYQKPAPAEGFQDITEIDFKVPADPRGGLLMQSLSTSQRSSKEMRSKSKYGYDIGIDENLEMWCHPMCPKPSCMMFNQSRHTEE
ncbi:DNA kinase Pnk1 [Coleophoma cylindrospora]|uniref:DNA kinase Pnk1 n=1 Tax=Coleophoma cylindrospora TaxID=1849047 RepID=A0A3D8QG56_9HELO|nr:DNA kinase Pnk1 [Coleophoma cylindrospora]